MLISATFMAFLINPNLVTVFLVAIPFFVVMLTIISDAAYPCFRAMFKKYDALNSSVQENLISIRIVKALVRAKHEKEKLKNANDDFYGIYHSRYVKSFCHPHFGGIG